MSLEVSLQNVSVHINGSLILNEVTATVPAKKSAALVGRSGGGKTTLLRTIAGLRPPTNGELLVGGRAPSTHYPTRDIAYLFQDPRNWRHKTVQQTLELTYELHELPPDQEQIRDILQKLGLLQAKDLYPHQCSHGMRARLQIGRAFCLPPGLLLADEPFASLDSNRRHQLNLELRSLQSLYHSTAIWVTHDIPEALQFADLVFIVGDRPGRIVAQYDMSNYPNITDPSSLPAECLALRDEIRGHLHLGETCD